MSTKTPTKRLHDSSTISDKAPSPSPLFATSQGAFVTIWRPVPTAFVPPIGFNPSHFKNGTIPLMTFDVGFDVHSLAFTPKFDCLAILGNSNTVLTFSLDFSSNASIKCFLECISQKFYSKKKSTSLPYQDYFPHPSFNALKICVLPSEKKPFRSYDINALLQSQNTNNTHPVNARFTFSYFLTTNRFTTLVFWGPGIELFQLTLEASPKLQTFDFGAEKAIIGLAISCDEARFYAVTAKNHFIVYHRHLGTRISYLLDGVNDFTPVSLTASPVDPNRLAISFRTGEIGIFTYQHNTSPDKHLILPASEKGQSASQPSFSSHEPQLAWVDSRGRLFFNDLCSHKSVCVDAGCPLSSTFFHTSCKTLVSTTPQGGLVVHSLKNLGRPMWALRLPLNSLSSPISALAFKPVHVRSTPSPSSLSTRTTYSFIEDSLGTDKATTKTQSNLPIDSPKSPQRFINDIEPSFRECFSPLKRPRIFRKASDSLEQKIARRNLLQSNSTSNSSGLEKPNSSVTDNTVSNALPISNYYTELSDQFARPPVDLNIHTPTSQLSESFSILELPQGLSQEKTYLDSKNGSPSVSRPNSTLVHSRKDTPTLYVTEGVNREAFVSDMNNDLHKTRTSSTLEIHKPTSKIKSLNKSASNFSVSGSFIREGLSFRRKSSTILGNTNRTSPHTHFVPENSEEPGESSLLQKAFIPDPPETENLNKPSMEPRIDTMITKDLIESMVKDSMYNFKNEVINMMGKIQGSVYDQLIKINRDCDALRKETSKIPHLIERLRDLEAQNEQLRARLKQ